MRESFRARKRRFQRTPILRYWFITLVNQNIQTHFLILLISQLANLASRWRQKTGLCKTMQTTVGAMYMMVTIAHLAYRRSCQLLSHVPQLPLTVAVIHVTYSCVYDGYCSQHPRVRNNKLFLLFLVCYSGLRQPQNLPAPFFYKLSSRRHLHRFIHSCKKLY